MTSQTNCHQVVIKNEKIEIFLENVPLLTTPFKLLLSLMSTCHRETTIKIAPHYSDQVKIPNLTLATQVGHLTSFSFSSWPKVEVTDFPILKTYCSTRQQDLKCIFDIPLDFSELILPQYRLLNST